MRDIYLIDFENVASEGLSGITFLSPEDQVIIFYSNNSNRLTMKMHILIGKSVCRFNYFEVTVGGKNALDHQISTWLGFLVGTKAADRNYYIVSKDMGYKFVASFWRESELRANVRCVESVRAASRLDRRGRKEAQETTEIQEAPAADTPMETVPEQPEVPEPVRSPILPGPEAVNAEIASAVGTVAETEASAPDAIAEAVWDAYTQEGREQHRELPEALTVPASKPEEPEPKKEEKYVPGAAFWSVPAKKFVPEAVAEPETPHAPSAPEEAADSASSADPGEPAAESGGEAAEPTGKEAENSHNESGGESPRDAVEAPAQPEAPEEAPAAEEEKFIPGAAFWAVPAREQPQPEQPEQPEDPEPAGELPAPEAPVEPEGPAEPAPAVKRHREAYPKEPVELPLDASDEDLAAEAAADRVRTRSRGAKSRGSRSDSRRSARQSRQEQPKAKEPAKEQPKPKETPKEQPKAKEPHKEQPKPQADKKPARQARAKQEEPRKVDISAMIAPYPELQEQHLQQLIAENQRQKLCNHLRKHLGQEKGLALYNEIKKKVWH